MAKMFPSKLPESIRNDPMRSAEVEVYDALEKQLVDDYHVFYSSPWLGIRPDGSEIDGEADFTVAHPVRGMLTIEVKGGGVSVDRDNNWTATDRFGFVRKIKNPVAQARQSKHELLAKLNDSNLWRPRFINACHGVILPHVSTPDNPLRPDMPLTIFAFGQDMAYLDAWVENRLGRREQPLGPDGLRALDDLLAGPITLQFRLSAGINQDMAQIQLKTAEQVAIMRELNGNRRMRIAGAAGTGKTVLALEKAAMLSKAGKRTLLLCYNKPLSLWLQKSTEEYPPIQASHFDKFCRDVAVAAGRDGSDRSLEEIAASLVDNFVNAGLEEFDAVIIDEGQDFRGEWLKTLEVVVRDSREGVLYVFYDNNQNVMSVSSAYLASLPSASYELTRNFRNTRTIFKQAVRYYLGGIVNCIGPLGLPISWQPLDATAGLWNRISERTRTLIADHGLEPEQITVLLPSKSVVEAIVPRDRPRLGNHPVVNAEHRSKNSVTVDAIRRFKGLESPVVLLVVTGDLKDQDELLYTGITRAQVFLEILAPPRLLEGMKKQT